MFSLAPLDSRPLIGFYFDPYLSDDKSPMINSAIGYAKVRGASMAAEIFGFRLIVSDEPDFFERTDGLSALLYYSSANRNAHFVRAAHLRGLPVITLSSQIDPQIPCILQDDSACFKFLTRHLLDSGHRRLAYVGGVEGHPHDSLRLAGFEAALEEFSESVVPASVGHAGSWMYKEMRKCLPKAFDPTSDVDAVVCANDGIAMGVMDALYHEGKHLPDDVSVVGFDNLYFRQGADPSLYSPPLTSGVLPTFEMGYLAVQVLRDHFDGAVIPEVQWYEPGVVWRGSVAARDGATLERSALTPQSHGMSSMLNELYPRLLDAQSPVAELGQFLLAKVRAGLSDQLALAIFKFTASRLQLCNLEAVDRSVRESRLTTLLHSLLEADFSLNYRDYHDKLVGSTDLAFSQNTYVTLTIQERSDVVGLIDSLRHDLGIEALCLEFLEHPAEAWFCVESEAPHVWKPDDYDSLKQILFSSDQIVKMINIEGQKVARLFLDFDVAREIDADRLVSYIQVNYLHAQMSKMLKARTAELEHEKQNAVLARDDAMQANRAKSSFLAMMSHEIRTPMNGVVGCASLLEFTSLDDEQKDLLKTIQTSAENLMVIINDILDFSKIEAGKIQLEESDFDLRECVEDSLDLFRFEANRKGLELAYEIEEHVPEQVVGDVTRLRQILINLVGNAIKFTEDGEVVVRVRAMSVDLADSICRLDFSVSDTGVGISQQAMENLFKPFSQADSSTTRRFGGTGLGLTICKLLSKLMKGGISVASRPGEGSTFAFNVQLGLGVTATGDQEALDHALFEKRSVLIVDDNDTNRKILVDMLASWGLRTTALASPEKAIAHLDAGNRYDLGIFDYEMPGLDGVSLSRVVHSLAGHKSMPVIILSSSVEDVAKGQDVDVAMRKPPKTKHLKAALRQLIGQQPELSTETARERVNERIESKDARILVAEDNAVNRTVINTMLKRTGYRTVDMVEDGDEALTAVNDGNYDLVLMDVSMPRMDGLEATRRIRELPHGAPDSLRIIGLSAGALPGDREAALDAGMDGYLTKPIKLQELKLVLENFLGSINHEA